MGQGPLEGVRFGHSWVEADAPDGTTRIVLDYSSGNSLVMDRDTYRFLQQARGRARSTASVRPGASRRTAIYGPWTADVLAAWHP